MGDAVVRIAIGGDVGRCMVVSSVPVAGPVRAGLATSPDGDRLYVGPGRYDQVSVIDTGRSQPDEIAVTPDGRYRYADSPGGNVRGDRYRRRCRPNGAYDGLWMSSGGKRLHAGRDAAAEHGGKEVVAGETSSGAVLGSVRTDHRWSIAASPDDRLMWVSDVVDGTGKIRTDSAPTGGR